MPRQEKKTKLYVGKIFSLRTASSIKCTKTSSRPGYNAEHKFVKSSDLGDRVLILDEGSTKVEVLPMSTTNPSPVWIAKYYLLTEIREEIEGDASGELGKVISELGSVRKLLSQCHPSVPDQNMINVEKSIKSVDKLLRRMRTIQETLSTES